MLGGTETGAAPGECDEGDDRTRNPAQGAQPRPVGGRAAQYHSDPVQRADRGDRRGHAQADGDRSRPADRRARRRRGRPAGRARCQLGTLPRDDFPVIAEGELPGSFELPADTLKQIVDKTRFAISTEETRYYLNGIFWHVSDDPQPVLKAAATDGHRLARETNARPDGAESLRDVNIPRSCDAALRKLLDEIDGSVGVALSSSKIRFDLGHALLTSK